MIIGRAFVREVLQTTVAVTVILFSIFLVIRLVGFLGAAAEGDIAMNSIFLLLLLKMISYLDVIIPLVAYISIILVMGRWIRDNELTVISACGIGMTLFLRPLFILCLTLSVLLGTLSLYLSPLSAEIGIGIEHTYRTRSDVTGIIPGKFTETRGGQGVFFVESYDRKSDTFRNIFVYNAGEEDGVVTARTGFKDVDEATGNEFLVLKDGSQYRGNPGEESYWNADFKTYSIRLDSRSGKGPALPVKARPTASLLEARNPQSVSEIHWRFSKILVLPVLLLFALCFSSITYRKSRFPNILPALLVYFCYTNLLGIALALMRREDVPMHAALWTVHALFLLLAVYMFRRRALNLRLLPGLPAR